MKSYTLKIKAQTNTNRFLVGVSCDLLATLVFFVTFVFLRFHPVLQRQDTGYGGMPRLLLCLGQMLDRSFQLLDRRLAVRTLVVAQDDKALQGQPDVGLRWNVGEVG